MIDPGLGDRVVLVTGGNSPLGIGAATARAFAAQNAGVFIHYYRPAKQQKAGKEKAEADGDTPGMAFYDSLQQRSATEVVSAIRERGGRADCWEADLSDPGVVPELFDRAEQSLGPVSVVVNNAADYQADTLLPQSRSEGTGVALWDGGPATATVSVDSIDRHFAVNTRAVALIMAEFATRYVRHDRHWGRIVNVSKTAGCPTSASVVLSASARMME